MIIKANFKTSRYQTSQTQMIGNLRIVKNVSRCIDFKSDFSNSVLADMDGKIVYNKLGVGGITGHWEKTVVYFVVADNFPKRLLGKDKEYYLY